MTTPSITTWDGFAEATVTHDDRARESGRELVTVKPAEQPATGLHWARHRYPVRKPNRRRAFTVARNAMWAFLVAALFIGGITAAAHTRPAQPFYGLTPAQSGQVATTLEAPGYQLDSYVTATPNWTGAACTAVAHYMHGDKTRALQRLEVAYRHLHRGYLRTDVFWLLHDAKHHRNTDLAVQYLYEDCNGGSGS